MSDVEQVPSLIGEIYDAALDPTQWRGLLAKTRDFVGGSAATLFSKDTVRKELDVHYQCGGVDPYYQELYCSTYSKIDPSTTAQVLAGIGEVVCTINVMPYNDFVNTRLFQEWARPQRLADMAAIPLDKTATGAALFGVFRDERQLLFCGVFHWCRFRPQCCLWSIPV